MPAGGARANAGRPLGSVNRKTKAIAEMQQRLGLLTPLQVLETNMRFHFEAFEKELKKGRKASRDALETHLAKAAAAAVDAAPYRHAKYQAIAVKTETADPLGDFLREIDGKNRGLPNGGIQPGLNGLPLFRQIEATAEPAREPAAIEAHDGQD